MKIRGWLITGLFLLLPSILWLIKNPIDFSATSSFAYSLGQFLGILGFALFTLSLVLSLRLPFFERIFGNLAMSYRFHQWSGVIATALLILHPILLAVPTALYFPTKLVGFFLSPHIFTLLGTIGLIVLVISIIVTLFINLPYHIWRQLHRFLAIAFLLGALHGFYVTGAIQFSPMSRALLGIFGLAGLIAIFVRVIFKKHLLRRTKFTLDQIKVDGTIITLILKPINKPLTFKAGQFVYLAIHDPSIVDEHPFSIVSKEGDANLVIMAKMLGDDTNKFGSLKPGTLVDVEGPIRKLLLRAWWQTSALDWRRYRHHSVPIPRRLASRWIHHRPLLFSKGEGRRSRQRSPLGGCR